MDNEVSDLKHRVTALEDRVNRSDGMGEDITGQLNVIIAALMGSIQTPDSPGLVAKVSELRQQQQLNTLAIAECRASVARVEALLLEYKQSMPAPAELKKLKEVTEEHTGKIGYFAGWIGGAVAVVFVAWEIIKAVFKLDK